MSCEELWTDVPTGCDAENAGKVLLNEGACEQEKNSRSEVTDVLKDLSELRACYDELAAEADPYPHAKVLANRAEVPGSVFDDMSCFLLFAGGGKEGHLFRHPCRLQEQLFRWRCQLFLLPTITTSCLSVPPQTSSGSYQWYRQHYALLDRSSISLPATWVRSIMMLYKKKLKAVWSVLEAEAASVVAVRENERMKQKKKRMAMSGESGSEAETHKNDEVEEKEEALLRCTVCGGAARIPHSHSPASPFVLPSFIVPPYSPIAASSSPCFPMCWEAFAPASSLPREASPTHRSLSHYVTTLQDLLESEKSKIVAEKEECRRSAPPPYFFHSVILLRQVVHAHLWQDWSEGGVHSVVEQGIDAAEENNILKKEHRGSALQKKCHETEKSRAPTQKGTEGAIGSSAVNGDEEYDREEEEEGPSCPVGPPFDDLSLWRSSFPPPFSFSSFSPQTLAFLSSSLSSSSSLLVHQPRFLDALDLLPLLVRSFRLARGVCQVILLPPPPFPPAACPRAAAFVPGSIPLLPSTSSPPLSSFQFLFSASPFLSSSVSSSGYPGTYRGGLASPSFPTGLPVQEGGGLLLSDEDLLYTDILRAEFGNPEWLRYLLTMLLGAIQLQPPSVEEREGKWHAKDEKEEGEEVPPDRRAGKEKAKRCGEEWARRVPFASLRLPYTAPSAPTSSRPSFSPVERARSAQLLLRWSVGAERASTFVQLLSLLFIQAQCQSFFPHVYYRELVSALLRWGEDRPLRAEKEGEKPPHCVPSPPSLPSSFPCFSSSSWSASFVSSSFSSPPSLSFPKPRALPIRRLIGAAAVCRSAAFRELVALLIHHLPHYLHTLLPFAQLAGAFQHYRAVVLLQMFGIPYACEEDLCRCSDVTATVMPFLRCGQESPSPPVGGGGGPPAADAAADPTSWAGREGDGREAATATPPSRRSSSVPYLHPPRFSLTEAVMVAPLLYHYQCGGGGPPPPFTSSSRPPPTAPSPSVLVAALDATIPPIPADLPPEHSFLYHAYAAVLRPLLWVFLNVDERMETTPIDGLRSRGTPAAASLPPRSPLQDVPHPQTPVHSADGGLPAFASPSTVPQDCRFLLRSLARTAVQEMAIPVSSHLTQWRALRLGPHPPMAMCPLGRLTWPLAMRRVLQEIVDALKWSAMGGGNERERERRSDGSGHPAPTNPNTKTKKKKNSTRDVEEEEEEEKECPTAATPPPPFPTVEQQVWWLTSHVMQIDLLLHSLLEEEEEEEGVSSPTGGVMAPFPPCGSPPRGQSVSFPSLKSLEKAALGEGIDHLYPCFTHALLSLHPTTPALLSQLLVHTLHAFLLHHEGVPPETAGDLPYGRGPHPEHPVALTGNDSPHTAIPIRPWGRPCPALLPLHSTAALHSLLRLSRCADPSIWEGTYQEWMLQRLMSHPDPLSFPASSSALQKNGVGVWWRGWPPWMAAFAAWDVSKRYWEGTLLSYLSQHTKRMALGERWKQTRKGEEEDDDEKKKKRTRRREKGRRDGRKGQVGGGTLPPFFPSLSPPGVPSQDDEGDGRFPLPHPIPFPHFRLPPSALNDTYRRFRPLYLTMQYDTAMPLSPLSSSTPSIHLLLHLLDWRHFPSPMGPFSPSAGSCLGRGGSAAPAPKANKKNAAASPAEGAVGMDPPVAPLAWPPLPLPPELLSATAAATFVLQDARFGSIGRKQGLRYPYTSALSTFLLRLRLGPPTPSSSSSSCLSITIHTTLLVHRILLALGTEYDAGVGVSLQELTARVQSTLQEAPWEVPSPWPTTRAKAEAGEAEVHPSTPLAHFAAGRVAAGGPGLFPSGGEGVGKGTPTRMHRWETSRNGLSSAAPPLSSSSSSSASVSDPSRVLHLLRPFFKMDPPLLQLSPPSSAASTSFLTWNRKALQQRYRNGERQLVLSHWPRPRKYGSGGGGARTTTSLGVTHARLPHPPPLPTAPRHRPSSHPTTPVPLVGDDPRPSSSPSAEEEETGAVVRPLPPPAGPPPTRESPTTTTTTISSGTEEEEGGRTPSFPSPLFASPPSPSAVLRFRTEKVKMWVLQHLKRVRRLGHEELWDMLHQGGQVPLPAAEEETNEETPGAPSRWVIPPLSFHISVGMFKVVLEALIEKKLLRRVEGGVCPSSLSLPHHTTEMSSEALFGMESGKERKGEEAEEKGLVCGESRQKRSSASGGVFYECLV